MDKKDIDELIETRKRERNKVRSELVNRAQCTSFLDDPNVTEHAKKEERILREMIRERQFVMTKKEMAKKAKELLGKGVSTKRIAQVQERMKQEMRLQFKGVDSFEAAFSAFQTYAELKDQLGQLILEAELISDPKSRVKAKTQILDKYKHTQEAEDRMFKMAGVHKEQIILEQLDIRDTQQWKAFQSAVLVFLRYALECPQCGHTGFDPEDFLVFIERVARDPSYIDTFISKQTRMNRAQRKMKREDGFKDYVEIIDEDEVEDNEETGEDDTESA